MPNPRELVGLALVVHCVTVAPAVNVPAGVAQPEGQEHVPQAGGRKHRHIGVLLGERSDAVSRKIDEGLRH
eukprot:6059016-Lingulodinium_polyedra.AAC.1